MHKTVDKPFLFFTGLLVVFGVLIFSSASLGLLARENASMSGQVINQVIALAIGIIAAAVAVRMPPRAWHRYAFYFFLAAIGVTLLVFVPGIGHAHGGAARWLAIGPFSVQPGEVLKFAFVLYYAAWCSALQKRMHLARYSLIPLIALLLPTGVVLALQPDYGTLIIITVAAVCMLIVAGARWKHIVILCLVSAALISAVGLSVPYVRERISTFLDPNRDPLNAGYQLRQSLYAVGSGQIVGRGFGQSIQKFNSLPEPIGDSIFAVFAEEWGFAGSVVLIALFIAFCLRGLHIAARAPNAFSRLVVVGFSTIITVQSFINMGSMLGIFPLTGDPLVFVSQGGTSIVISLLEVGIILAISKTLPAAKG